jgi:bacterioferritin-associated ferredoxin
MFICNCNGLRTDDINEALAAGAVCPQTVHAYHGCAEQCGRCRPEIQECLTQSLAVSALTPATARAA